MKVHILCAKFASISFKLSEILYMDISFITKLLTFVKMYILASLLNKNFVTLGSILIVTSSCPAVPVMVNV